MRTAISRLSGVPFAAALATLVLTAGCGSVSVESDDGDQAKETPSATPSSAADTSSGEGTWLLGMTTAGGIDGETSTSVYISYNPSTGQATARELPGVKAASASAEEASLLVSADRQWAIPDTTIPKAEEKSGELSVYSLTRGGATKIDIGDRTGRDDVTPIAWAFDPERAGTLRVVDTKSRVWAVNVAGGKAVQEDPLPTNGWVFLNGFNRNTGEPYVSRIDNEDTLPAGNGPADTDPVTREGGTVLPAGSPGITELPPSPCRLGAGYAEAEGLTWVFCADADTVTAFYLPEGAKEWTAYGKPSTPVAPEAAGFPLVLPPAE